MLDPATSLPPARLPPQKLCDAADFSDPRTDAIIRRIFRLESRHNARLWEFARAYDLLDGIGALRPGTRGISFGSGREVLLYAVANACDHLTVTDLYEPDTAWLEARAPDPHGFVMAGAPFPVDPARLAVRSMDARAVDYPDASFDFAYSISAFEHFGDDPDFLAHLREVRRVLKPGGAYVLTTEVVLGPNTLATRGNYAFTLDHLLHLFREAGLAPGGTFHMGLTESSPNEPREDVTVLHFGNAGIWTDATVLRDHAGDISTPVCFLLRPDVAAASAAPTVIGLNRSIAWAAAAMALRNTYRHQEWVRLNPFGFLPGGRSEMLDLHGNAATAKADGELAFCTGYAGFGTGHLEWRLTLATSTDIPSHGRLSIGINEFHRQDAGIQGVRQETVTIPTGIGNVIQLRFDAPVRNGYAYALYGAKATGHLALASVDVMVRHMPAPAADH